MAKIDFKNIQTMIGAEAVVNGPIKLHGGIIVYGKVYGDIHTDGPVRITISGQVIGDVQASDAHIGGSIQGNVTVSNSRRLYTSPSPRDLSTPRMPSSA